MKMLFNYATCLLLVCFIGNKALAQSASLADNGKNVKPKPEKGLLNIAEDSSIISNDASQAASVMEVFPNPSTGMITVKTACAGRLYFYNQHGKEKASCIVNEGDNPVYLQQVLYPGTYLCKFEGVNGSKAEEKVTYKL